MSSNEAANSTSSEPLKTDSSAQNKFDELRFPNTSEPLKTDSSVQNKFDEPRFQNTRVGGCTVRVQNMVVMWPRHVVAKYPKRGLQNMLPNVWSRDMVKTKVAIFFLSKQKFITANNVEHILFCKQPCVV